MDKLTPSSALTLRLCSVQGSAWREAGLAHELLPGRSVDAFGFADELVCNDMRELMTKNLFKNAGADYACGYDDPPSSNVGSTE